MIVLSYFRKIKDAVYSVGAVDWDRRLFDELIPLPNGTSYNSYLIVGSDKIALIDAVDPKFRNLLLTNLEELGVKKIDYMIANHAEQDHSGTIPDILEIYPEARVVCTEKCKGILIDLLHISEDKFIVVKDGDTISLGDKTLRFIHAPWVHWPETMLTYLEEDKILFSCDLFGSHLATSDLYVSDKCLVYGAAKRYYAEIMMPFRSLIRGHLKKVKELDLNIIAPSHGPMYDDPNFIIEAYEDWVSDKVKDEVVLAYVSMHGSTKAMVDYFVKALIREELTVKQFNLTVSDIGELAMALVDASTLVLASPTVLGGPHPSAVYAAYLANALRPKLKYISFIGSYSWGGRALEVIKNLLSALKVEFLEPVIIKGLPRNEDYEKLDRLARDISERRGK